MGTHHAGLIALLALLCLLAGSGRWAADSRAGGPEGSADTVHTSENPPGGETALSPQILTWDGAALLAPGDEGGLQPVWVMEETSVTIDFGAHPPDDVSAHMTLVYSGGSVSVLDPVPVPLTREGAARYTLLLPPAQTPLAFHIYHYDITATYGDTVRRYRFTVQLDRGAQVPEITVTAEDGASAAYSKMKLRWDGQAFDHEPLLQSTRFYLDPPPLPAQGGSTLRIDFGAQPPDSLTATATGFSYSQSSGHYFAGTPQAQELTRESDAIYSIALPRHTANRVTAFLGEDRVLLQGYTLTAVWGENICAYAFVVAIPAEQAGGGA